MRIPVGAARTKLQQSKFCGRADESDIVDDEDEWRSEINSRATASPAFRPGRDMTDRSLGIGCYL